MFTMAGYENEGRHCCCDGSCCYGFGEIPYRGSAAVERDLEIFEVHVFPGHTLSGKSRTAPDGIFGCKLCSWRLTFQNWYSDMLGKRPHVVVKQATTADCILDVRGRD